MNLLEAREIMGVDVRADGPDNDPDKPYGDVAYADPGYKDGKKRYPIDTKAHAKAAWSYINQTKNHEGYTSAQVDLIKGRIKAAAKKFGIEISDDANAEDIDWDAERSAGDGAGDGGTHPNADVMMQQIHDHAVSMGACCPEVL